MQREEWRQQLCKALSPLVANELMTMRPRTHKQCGRRLACSGSTQAHMVATPEKLRWQRWREARAARLQEGAKSRSACRSR